MTESEGIFLSYSRNDLAAAQRLHTQLKQVGPVFKDDESIRQGDLWLEKLQQAIAACAVFVVLVGRDRVRRWVGAETQVALKRHFGPHSDQQRLPIFPVLLDDTTIDDLPAFLQLFQATPWDGKSELPATFLEQVRKRADGIHSGPLVEGCPFVGLAAYTASTAHLFFGRQQETLDALACFELRRGAPDLRWLEINGNSGAGKSSLMNAGILPLVAAGWLWPRTRIEHWQQIGPMMPGERPLASLAESLARYFRLEMADVRSRLERDDDRALADWLRTRKKDDSAFLLAIDQFEELFTFADPRERKRFDGLLATALEDPDCPLFVISTLRADFLDRFETLPALVAVRNRKARPWTLPQISEQGLREIIDGPARLAGLNVSEVREALIAEGRDEPGVLPLVEHALEWLWNKRDGPRLRGELLTESGGLAGILSESADELLNGAAKERRRRVLELLFQLVNVDPEGRRHTRRRISLADATLAAGGGDAGRVLINELAGQRDRAHATLPPLRLITVTEESVAGDKTHASGGETSGRWVNLIHETLIRRAPRDAQGEAKPYWPALWDYIEQNKQRAQRRERLRLQARDWQQARGFGRLFALAPWASVGSFRRLAAGGRLEARYLRWSRAVLALQVVVASGIMITVESAIWLYTNEYLRPVEAVTTRWSHWLGFLPPLPELVAIPAGSFMMGSEDGELFEQPAHEVSFAAPFYLSKTEITFEQYDSFAYYNGHPLPDDEGWGRGDRPVIDVDWNDARSYAEWLGEETGNSCRLPSEAEWEYAERAGTATRYALPAPAGGDDLSGYANCRDCGRSEHVTAELNERIGWRTLPVASFPANAWGVHDMHGNVLEWVADCGHDSYESAPDDGSAWLAENGGDCDNRVVRGGSWFYDQDDTRSVTRFGGHPANRSSYIGFRVLCSSPILSTDH